jgi:hypothetical protein
MGTTSLIDRQELKYKADRLYTPPEIIELFQSTGIEKDWSFIEYKPSDTSKLTHCYDSGDSIEILFGPQNF